MLGKHRALRTHAPGVKVTPGPKDVSRGWGPSLSGPVGSCSPRPSPAPLSTQQAGHGCQTGTRRGESWSFKYLRPRLGRD